jgi:tetratricopeptide (TPR) repeat protein
MGHRDALQLRAGEIELGIAQMYAERNQKAREQAIYQVFFKYFLKHPRAAGFLYRFGDECYTQQKRYDEALGYFRQIADNHTNSPFYYEALSKMASCYQDKGDRTNEIKVLAVLIDAARPVAERGHLLISGLYRRGAAYRELARQDKKALLPAARDYSEVVKLLTADPARYQRTADEKERNQKLLEGGIYYKATCFANMVPPAGKPASAYKDMAVKAYEDLLSRFPKSDLAPRALSQIGTLYTILQKPDEAERAFIRLQKEYPDSDDARNAMFLRGKNLLDLGLYQQAIKVFTDMFSGTAGKYSDTQIFTAGNELLKYKQHEIAITAFTRVENSAEKGIREAALNGKGTALVELNRMDEAVKVLEALLGEFKNTGYTVDACFNLSKAYSVLGSKEADQAKRKEIFAKAIDAMKRSRKFVKDKGVQSRSDIEIARIYMRMAKAATDFGPKPQVAECKGDAIATYQIMMMTANPQDVTVRPYLEEAYYECLPLMVELERWSDVASDGEGYLKAFANGKYAPEVRAWVNRAKGRLAAGGTAGPAQ